jgi:glutathione-independent formaldehyde dehydrogenase
MGGNRIVVYKEPGVVAVEDHDMPKLEVPADVASAMGMSRKADHAVILRNVSTNICGSDQHMVRGRTDAPPGQTLGHEITGEVVEKGSDVQFLEVGDICTVPFNIACGRCRNCREGQTGVCVNVNPARAGSAYGYVDMGGWEGGQADFVMVPFADFNLLKFPDRDQALAKIKDLTMLSDIFPTGYHGAVTAGVTTGSTVYVAGAGPVGLAAAYSALLLGAAAVVVGDLNADRLAQARSFGCETVDVSADATLEDQIGQILGTNEVDCAVDAVGFEATGHGAGAGEQPAAVLNSIMTLTRPRGWEAGHPGAVRDRRPGSRRRGRQGGHAQGAPGSGLGEEPHPHDRPVPRPEVQPGPDDEHPARPGAHRRRRQRHGDPARGRPARLPGVRQRRGAEVRARPARHGARVGGQNVRTGRPTAASTAIVRNSPQR